MMSKVFLPLHVDFIKENAVAANLMLHSHNSLIHKFWFAVYFTYVLFSKNSTLVHKIVSSTHNHDVSP